MGARTLGLGGAYTAVADETSALYWNPAGLSRLSAQRELSLSHAQLAADARYDFAGYAQPTRFGTLAAAGAYLGQPALQGRDAAGRPSGGFTASDSSVSLGFGRSMNPDLCLGGAVKYVRSTIAEVSAQSYAVDLGAQRVLNVRGPGMPTVGLAVLNLGPGMKFLNETSPLPLTFAGGLGYQLNSGLLLALDVRYRPYAPATEVAVGTEFAVLRGFALRSGFSSGASANGGSKGFSAINGFSGGFGLKLGKNYGLDYAVAPFGELGSVQRFSLGARFK